MGKTKYEYVEYENLIYRGPVPAVKAPIVRMIEVAVGGKWQEATAQGFVASRMGMPMDEDEALQFAGDDWPD